MKLSNSVGLKTEVRLVADIGATSDGDEIVGMLPLHGRIVIVTKSGKILLVENDEDTQVKVQQLASQKFGEALCLEGKPSDYFLLSPSVERMVHREIMELTRRGLQEMVHYEIRSVLGHPTSPYPPLIRRNWGD